MNLLAPVSSIMTKALYTCNPEDSLLEVKKVFDEHHIHHLPIVRFRKMVGLISRTDLLPFLVGARKTEKHNPDAIETEEAVLRKYKAEDIMTKGLAFLDPADRINVALDIFKLNKIHVLPIIENDELLGLISTQDIIKALAEE